MAIEHVASASRALASRIHHSKITVPTPGGVARPDLVARIEGAVQGKLTVLAAPAGWGKTAALAEWAAGTPMNVV